MVTSLSGTNYVLNEHEDLSQYGSYAIATEMMPCYSYPASSLVRHSIPNMLPFYQARLALIMSLKRMKMYTNMAHILHHLR